MIDRTALVARHDPRYRAPQPHAPLGVGNGEFAVSVDATGLQTFPAAYSLTEHGGAGTLLGTQAQWAWHSSPAPEGATPEPRTVDYRVGDRLVPYVDLPDAAPGGEATDPTDAWRRENPHRLHLGLMGLRLDGAAPALGDLEELDQHLDMAAGVITSRFTWRGTRLAVTTCVHPDRDAVAVRIARLGGPARAGLSLHLPYGSGHWADPADFGRDDAHTTELVDGTAGQRVRRRLDADGYDIVVHGAALQRDAPHRLHVDAEHDALELVLEFVRADEPVAAGLGVDAVLNAAAAHWHRFWSEGGVVAIEGAPAGSEADAAELERRTVLSQFLTAIHCAGSTPPAETGLVTNSWRGKFHLEMHWWHAAHFPQWGRPQLLERSLGWYARILPQARETARRQGYAGARWPKQVGPEGVETPSSIGPFLLWQQPHPIHLAELVRRADPTALDRYAELVDESAAFMASIAVEREGAFHLDGPLIPAQESYEPTRATNSDPVFELAYWRWALLTAVRWRERRGVEAPALWRRVAEGMAVPAVAHGRYLGQRVEPTLFRDDHPSHLAALGVVPDTGFIDHGIMGATLDDVLADWHWPSTWGWDYPVMAMTATRLGRPSTAVASLLRDAPKNHYRPNGHNAQTALLPLYLPGNGGLLAAVGLMAAGWGDRPATTPPGFPAGWRVRSEGVLPMP